MHVVPSAFSLVLSTAVYPQASASFCDEGSCMSRLSDTTGRAFRILQLHIRINFYSPIRFVVLGLGWAITPTHYHVQNFTFPMGSTWFTCISELNLFLLNAYQFSSETRNNKVSRRRVSA